MRTQIHFAGLAVVFIMPALAVAQGTWPAQVDPSFGAPPNFVAPTATASPTDTVREIQELRQRLERCEAELHDRDANQLPAGTPVTPASYAPSGTSTSAELLNPGLAKKPDAASSKSNDPKPEPLITGPNLKIGAKAILDNAWFAQDNANRALVGDEQDYTGFRFLRLMFYGDLYENINYRLEVDMAQAQSSTNPALLAAFQDVWVNFRQLPLIGNLKVGFFKEPLGLEQQTGEEYLLFMERSLANTFVPGRRIGAMAYNDLNDEQTLTVFTGFYREGSGNKTFLEYSDLGDYGTTSRLVWLPYYDKASGGRYLAHLGGSFEYTGSNNNNTESKQFSVVPEINAQLPFTTVNVATPDYELFAAEAAIMNGPLLIKSEYISALLPRGPLADAYFDGGYVEALYCLTQENHNYNLPGKFFQGITPYEPFFRVRSTDGDICTGWGAWEIGSRISFIDLNSAGIVGGRLVDYTFGLHWYLTNNLSAMFNYIHSDFDKGAAKTDCDIVGTRIEWHF